MSQSTGTPERVALSTELSEFLVEFSIALHRTSMYPPGHPSQERSASGVIQRLASLLADRPSVSIGVAKRQLVIEGVATDPGHPVLRSLAEKFHRQHIGAVVINRGVSTAEILGMMELVAAETEKGERPLGLDQPEKLRQWAAVRLYSLTYDQLELVGGSSDDADDDGTDDQREQGTRSAQLWLGLARAALAIDDSTDAVTESTDPAVVAQAINEHPQAQAYDQVVVGYLLQIAQDLKRDGGAGSVSVRKRMSRLIGALDQDTLARLVEMGGDLAQRQRFTLDATESLAADAVVEIVRAAAETSGQTISSSMMRMLSKLSAFSEQGAANLQVQADTALREQVRELVQGWSLADPNPDEYTRALQSMAGASVGERAGTAQFEPEPLRIVQMALEVDAVGVPFWRAVATLERDGGLAELIATLQGARADGAVTILLWNHLANVDNIRSLLAREPADFASIDSLLDRIDLEAAIEILIDTIVASRSRATRMAVFLRLVMMGDDVYAAVGERLHDPRWYVQRNMLAILNELGHVPPSIAPSEFARHADARVRREALALWLRVPGERDRAIVACLKESDDRAFRIGLAAALQEGVPDSAIPVLTTRLADRNLTTDIQLQLVRALGQSGSLLAVETLLRVVAVGRTMFGNVKLAPATPVMLVALSTLAARWSNDARVAPVLQRARASKDPDIASILSKAVPP